MSIEGGINSKIFCPHQKTWRHKRRSRINKKLGSKGNNPLDAERSVRFVNYELKIRGAKELSAASSAQVKAKASDLIETRPSGSFKDYTEIGTVKIPEILAAWNTRQSELMAQGLVEKEVFSNLSVDKRRNADLDKLKGMGVHSCRLVK